MDYVRANSAALEEPLLSRSTPRGSKKGTRKKERIKEKEKKKKKGKKKRKKKEEGVGAAGVEDEEGEEGGE